MTTKNGEPGDRQFPVLSVVEAADIGSQLWLLAAVSDWLSRKQLQIFESEKASFRALTAQMHA